MSTQVILKNAVLSYPHLFQPRAYDARSEPRYSANFIMPQDFNWDEVNAAIEEVKQTFGDNPPANLRLPVKQVTDGPYAGFFQVVSATPENRPPQVVTQDPRIPVTNPGAIFAGCIVNAYVNFYDYKGGVSAGLNAVQLVQNTDVIRLDGGKDASEIFQAIEGAPQPTAPTPSAPVAPQPAASGAVQSAPVPTPAPAPATPGVAPAGGNVPNFIK